MKLPIKFRGKAPSGEIICGACKPILTRRADSGVVAVGRYLHILSDIGEWRMVSADTVAQFVGYDKNGKMIFSDDKIRVYDHSRYCMAGTGIEIAGDFIKVNDIGKTFDNVELLEEIVENEKSTSD